jgi:hypothetical protein
MSPAPPQDLPNRFPPETEEERAALLEFARKCPLVYGPWQSFKRLCKQAEGHPAETELLGEIFARLDAAPFHDWSVYHSRRGLSIGEIRALAVGDNHAFVASGTKVHLVHLTDPKGPAAGRSLTVGRAHDLLVHGSRVYVATLEDRGGGARVRILDVSDPSIPVETASVELPNEIRGMAATDRHLFVTATGDLRAPDGLHVFDVADAQHPRRVAGLELPGAGRLALAGRYLYVCEREEERRALLGVQRSGGLRIVDISDPTRPQVAGRADTGTTLGVASDGRRACVVAQEAKGKRRGWALKLLDVGDPTRPRQLAARGLQHLYAMEQYPACLILHRDHLIVAAGSGMAQVYHLADPPRIKEVAPLGFWGASGMGITGDTLVVAGRWSTLVLFAFGNPAHPVQLGRPPNEATLGYMKRRARRFMRRLAESDPDRFVEIAFRVLTKAGHGKDELELGLQWVSADLLFGGSGRYYQSRHGRGSYRPREERFYLRTREERAPAAWDRHPDLARRLYTAQQLPWQVYEAALRMLRANSAPGAELPSLSIRLLRRFLESPSPLLRVVAACQAGPAFRDGELTDPVVAALAFLYARPGLQRSMAEEVRDRAPERPWDQRFAAPIVREVLRSLAGQARCSLGARRVAMAASLLVARFAAVIEDDDLRSITLALLSSTRREAAALGLELIRRSNLAVPEWLGVIEGLPEAQRCQVLEALTGVVLDRPLELDAAREMVFSRSAWQRQAGWQLVAAGAAAGVAAALWRELLSQQQDTPALQTALNSAAALGLLGQVQLAEGDPEIALRPFLLPFLTEQTLRLLIDALPVAVTVRMVTDAPVEAWPWVRGILGASLRSSERLAAFWQAAWSALGGEEAVALRERLLADPELAETFLALDDPGFLERADAAAGPLLLRWARAHEEQFTRDSPALLAAATNPGPELRAWALDRLRALGMELPFALRLMESELPEPAALGEAFFQALPPGDGRELEYALALCDSPIKPVRAAGREFVRARWETLPREPLLASLGQHDDPQVQEYLAAVLLAGAAGEVARTFDAPVLRSRHRARRAKELVKTRLQRATETPDPAVLLELARGTNRRDREWALQQLARLALAGETIEGIKLEGVAGI